jgi:hypothetical protein
VERIRSAGSAPLTRNMISRISCDIAERTAIEKGRQTSIPIHCCPLRLDTTGCNSL